MSKHAVLVRGRSMRFSPVVIAAGVAASILLSLSFSGTLSAFTAAITNPTNTANTISVAMAEGPDATSTTCATDVSGAATCSTDLYNGRNLKPNDSGPTNSVVFTNKGSTKPASFSLTPGNCTGSVSGTNSICKYLLVTVTYGTGSNKVTVISGRTASDIANVAVPMGPSTGTGNAPAAGAQETATVSVQLDPNAPNESQSQSLTQPLVWKFTA